jgi:hypothetical protein
MQYAHSDARLEKREQKIRRSMVMVTVISNFFRWLAEKLGLIRKFDPPPPPSAYRTEV